MMKLSGTAVALLVVSLFGLAAHAQDPQDAPAAVVMDDGAAVHPVVITESGLVRGGTQKGNAVFRGIPYAAPPVGEERWRPPQPFGAWHGTRDALAFGSPCPQPAVPAPFGVTQPWSEDCLTLNIWTPEEALSDGRKRPVMFWIHGGAFVIGAGSQPPFDGEKLADRDVVVVTINYRLGALGFLAHPSLGAEQAGGPQGNYGLLDQIAALRWVRENIAQFGGDEGNVTIMGESSGGISVTALMTSPLANGLFHKAISQSGGGTAAFPSIRGSAISSYAIGGAWTTKLGLGARPSADAMRALPATAIVDSGFFSFPNIDGVVLESSPGDAFARGEQAAVPFIAGSNSDEASLVTLTDALASAALPFSYDRFLARYTQRGSSRLAPKDELRGELFFVQPTRFLVERQAANDVPSYLYYFDQVPIALRSALPGAPHGGELSYLFGVEMPPDGWDAGDRAVSAQMADRWVAFARSGSPNACGLSDWVPAQNGRAAALRLSSAGGIRLADDLDEDMMSAALQGARFLWGQ